MAMILTTERPLDNRERRAEWAGRYLLSGNDMISGSVIQHLERHMAQMFAASDVDEPGYSWEETK